MKEYRLTKGWIIFHCVFVFLLVVLYIFLIKGLFDPVYPNSTKDIYLLGGIYLLTILLFIKDLIDTLLYKIIITEDSIIRTRLFANKELKFEEILGFKDSHLYICVKSKFENRKKIYISIHTRNKEEILNWLNSNFTDLDKQMPDQIREQ